MRRENTLCRQLLLAHGITKATPRFLFKGSLRGCWHISGPGAWTQEHADKINAAGFVGFDGQPLDRFSGNGGAFSIIARGHLDLVYR